MGQRSREAACHLDSENYTNGGTVPWQFEVVWHERLLTSWNQHRARPEKSGLYPQMSLSCLRGPAFGNGKVPDWPLLTPDESAFQFITSAMSNIRGLCETLQKAL